MPWLSYSSDEVLTFHPVFEVIANQALLSLGLHHQLEWVHHLRTPGNPLVPDFVLRRKLTGHWVLAFELKRTRDAVFSTRNQIQAKSYAELNQDRYSPTKPRYFAISNVEITILYALNGDRPPRECRLLDGLFESGTFSSTPEATHKEQFIRDLQRICSIAITAAPPEFDTVWQGVLSDFLSHVDNIDLPEHLLIPE